MSKLPQSAQEIIDKLNKAGFECFAVGGSVRDILMRKETKGWDFTTNATPNEIMKIFPVIIWNGVPIPSIHLKVMS